MATQAGRAWQSSQLAGRYCEVSKQKANLWGAERHVHVPVFLTNAHLIVLYDSSPETQTVRTRHQEYSPPTHPDPKGNFIIRHIWAKHVPYRK